MAVADSGTGELTLAPFTGLAIVRGNPHNEAGAGSDAGGTMDVLEGGTGVTGQFATLLGSPWHPAKALRIAVIIMPIRTRYVLPLFLAVIRIFPVDLRGFSCPRLHPRAGRNAVKTDDLALICR